MCLFSGTPAGCVDARSRSGGLRFAATSGYCLSTLRVVIPLSLPYMTSGVVHHGVRPLAVSEWRSLVESEGFEVQTVDMATMSLLEPGRLIRDEGLAGAARFVWNLLRDSEARKRVLEMRSVFRRQRKQLGAVAIVGIKR
jgi:hypothetical protein